MAFPLDQDNIQPLSQQAILVGVAGVSAGQGAFRVSSITTASVTFSGDAANNRVSAIQQDAANLMVSSKSGDAGLLRTSALNQDANFMHTSSFSPDASLFRVSSIGASTASNDILVDGVDNTVSARIKQISAVLSASDNAFIVHTVSEGAGRNQVSAKSLDAGTLLISAKQGDAGLLRISSFVDSGSVSAKSSDAATFRVSAINSVSSLSPDAALFRVSAIIDNGSVSAKSSDAGTNLVSAKQGDAGLLRVSGFTATATNFPVSSTQGDASLLRISSFGSVVTTNTGGASFFSTSAGIAQLSAIKQSGGRLYGYHLTHGAGNDQYLLVFNASATSAVTLGTTVPDLYLGVPAGTGSNAGAGAVQYFDQGISLPLGITVAVVSAVNGTTAGASAMRVNIFFA